MKTCFSCCCLLWLALCSQASGAIHTRPLFDIVDVQGIRENQLVGYGLVVGLSNTGDKAQVKFTGQSMTNMLKQFGVQLPDDIDPKLKNVAAVSVSADLPAFAKPGQQVDITVKPAVAIGGGKQVQPSPAFGVVHQRITGGQRRALQHHAALRPG